MACFSCMLAADCHATIYGVKKLDDKKRDAHRDYGNPFLKLKKISFQDLASWGLNPAEVDDRLSRESRTASRENNFGPSEAMCLRSRHIGAHIRLR